MTEWNEDRVTSLKAMWADGKSARLIAAELGVTRNSIIGKARRLGLEARVAAKKRPDPHLVAKVGKVANLVRRTTVLHGPASPQKRSMAGVSILDVGQGQCRTIIGTGTDPNGLAVMCGEPVYENTSWCEKHFLQHTTFRRA